MERYLTTTSGKRVIGEYPNECPICHKAIEPIDKCREYNKNNKVYVLFECPSCREGFISHYHNSHEKVIYKSYEYEKISLIDSYPKQIKTIEIEDSIKKISPTFCNIYNQAYASEQYGLNDISGIGYRKALEFLIKDYCIYKNNGEEEQIKKEPLGQVINDFIDSDRIKKLAKASSWIGNDETHYIRKYIDKDVNDLKKFIETTKAFIHYELISDEAEELVESNAK